MSRPSKQGLERIMLLPEWACGEAVLWWKMLKQQGHITRPNSCLTPKKKTINPQWSITKCPQNSLCTNSVPSQQPGCTAACFIHLCGCWMRSKWGLTTPTRTNLCGCVGVEGGVEVYRFLTSERRLEMNCTLAGNRHRFAIDDPSRFWSDHNGLLVVHSKYHHEYTPREFLAGSGRLCIIWCPTGAVVESSPARQIPQMIAPECPHANRRISRRPRPTSRTHKRKVKTEAWATAHHVRQSSPFRPSQNVIIMAYRCTHF